MNEDYLEGFMIKCAEAGIDPEELVKTAAMSPAIKNLLGEAAVGGGALATGLAGGWAYTALNRSNRSIDAPNVADIMKGDFNTAVEGAVEGARTQGIGFLDFLKGLLQKDPEVPSPAMNDVAVELPQIQTPGLPEEASLMEQIKGLVQQGTDKAVDLKDSALDAITADGPEGARARMFAALGIGGVGVAGGALAANAMSGSDDNEEEDNEV